MSKKHDFKIDLNEIVNFSDEDNPDPINYQKIWSDNDPDIDNTYLTCIFCNQPTSPKDTVQILNKKYKNPITKEKAGNPNIEYCCNTCASHIRSTTTSPRGSFITKSPIRTPTPREKRIGRRNSSPRPIRRDSSPLIPRNMMNKNSPQSRSMSLIEKALTNSVERAIQKKDDLTDSKEL
jgi:hypothetical protein